MARQHLRTASTFEAAATVMVVGLIDPRVRIEVEVTARRRGP